MSKRKFYRTTFTVEILTKDEPYPDGMLLEQMAHEMSTVDCVGRVLRTAGQKLTGKECADLLHTFGSDPGFFQLTDEGKDKDG